jgi:hypothetical protein
MVAHSYDLSYLEGRDLEDHAWFNASLGKKSAGVLNQHVGPDGVCLLSQLHRRETGGSQSRLAWTNT